MSNIFAKNIRGVTSVLTINRKHLDITFVFVSANCFVQRIHYWITARSLVSAVGASSKCRREALGIDIGDLENRIFRQPSSEA